MNAQEVREIQQKITARVEECFKQAEWFYGQKFLRPSSVKFTLGGTTAGKAYYDSPNGKLNFNLVLAHENLDEFHDEVAPHEVAHLISVALYGVANGKGHGVNWKGVMSQCFRLDPSQYHDMDVAEAKKSVGVATLKYQCACTVHNLSKIRHNRIINTGVKYTCKKCKGVLVQVAV